MLIVADNLQFSSPRLALAVTERDPQPIQEQVQKCNRSGAAYLDVNIGPVIKPETGALAFILDTLAASTDLPLILDTPRPDIMAAALAISDRIAMINGFSLEPHKRDAILPLAVQYGLPIIGFLLRPDGHVPVDATERLELATRLYDVYQSQGLDPARLIVDPLVVPLSWQDGLQQARDVLQVIQLLPDMIGIPVRTILGISNLTTGSAPLSKKIAAQTAFLAMAAGSGLDLALMNIDHSQTVQMTQAYKVLSEEMIFTWESIRG